MLETGELVWPRGACKDLELLSGGGRIQIEKIAVGGKPRRIADFNVRPLEGQRAQPVARKGG